MEPSNNYIDDLVRKSFPDKVTNTDDAELWNRISRTMRFKRFLRFSLSSFNIYYSVLTIFLISSAAYFFINQNSQNTAPANNNSILAVPSAKDCSQPELKSDKIIEPSVSAIPQANGQKIQAESSEKTDTNSSLILKNKTVKPSSPFADNGYIKPKKVKVVKKQLIITDTIHKKDTVYIKKASTPKYSK